VQPSPWLQHSAAKLDQFQSPFWQNDRNDRPIHSDLEEMLSRLSVEAVAGQTRDDSCRKFSKNLSPL
jgi:hypothetical protein